MNSYSFLARSRLSMETSKAFVTSVTFKFDANACPPCFTFWRGMRTQKIQGAATTSYILGEGGNTEVVVTGSTALTYNFFAGLENVGQGKRSGGTLASKRGVCADEEVSIVAISSLRCKQTVSKLCPPVNAGNRL